MQQKLSLEKYTADNSNMLVPTQHIEQVSPWHVQRVAEVKISADPDKGEIFKVGSRPKGGGWENLYCLGKPALMRIASVAGIRWNWTETKAITINRDYVCFQAVGIIILPDGTPQPIKGTKEIDLTVIEEELRDQYTKKAEGSIGKDAQIGFKGSWKETGEGKSSWFLLDSEKPRWIDAQVKSNLIQWRKHKLARCETGAMHRVIRAALGLKSQYTAEDLSKPFIVPHVDFSPDYNDPNVQRALLAHGINGMQSLFQNVAPMQLPRAIERPMIEAPQDDVPDEHQNVTFHEAVIEEPESESPAQEPTTQPTQEQNGESYACSDCSAKVNANVCKFSQEHYGRILCFKCQKIEKAKEANAA